MKRIHPTTSREIFGNPQPVQHVTEDQFDGLDDQLRKLARTPWQEVKEIDLWYYFHDLTYMKLQPGLFEYLFPLCLNFWYDTMMRDEGTGMGDSDFQHSLIRGDVLVKMLTPSRREQVYDFMRDGLLDCIDTQGTFPRHQIGIVSHKWLQRFNSTGIVAPIVERIWEKWWNFDSPGKAICGVIWLSGLLYQPEENPFFGESNQIYAEDMPGLSQHDIAWFFRQLSWMPENRDFLRRTLRVDYLESKINVACDALAGSEYSSASEQIYQEFAQRKDSLDARVENLLKALTEMSPS